MLPDRVSNPGPLTYESGALPIALRGPAGSEEEDFNSFLFISLVQTQDTLGRIHFGSWGHYFNKLG